MEKKYLMFILPVITFMALFFVYPMFNTFKWSFFDYSPIRGTYTFVGLQNYLELPGVDLFKTGVVKSAVWTIVVTGLVFSISLAAALVTYTKFKGSKIFRILFTMPMCLIPSAVAIVWALFYSNPFGLINHFLDFFGYEMHSWLADPNITLFAVAFAESWFRIPMIYIMVTAGLESLPLAPQESAEIDGASYLQKLRHVILPMIKPILGIVFLFAFIDAFRVFAMLWIMTGGGPGIASTTLPVAAYRMGFAVFDYGMASAMSFILVLIAFVMAMIMIWRMKI